MTDLEIRANAMLQEVAAQRNVALDRCAVLTAEIATLKAKLAAAQPETTVVVGN